MVAQHPVVKFYDYMLDKIEEHEFLSTHVRNNAGRYIRGYETFKGGYLQKVISGLRQSRLQTHWSDQAFPNGRCQDVPRGLHEEFARSTEGVALLNRFEKEYREALGRYAMSADKAAPEPDKQ